MTELVTAIPDASFLLALAPEELGAKMVFLMNQRLQVSPLVNQGMFRLGSCQGELWNFSATNQPKYPNNLESDINLALSEAWAWLEAQGLLVPAPNSNSENGWRVLSRRAKAIRTEAEFANYKIARLLPRELLHPKIADSVWGAFMRGAYDIAAFQAMKAVEVSVRDSANLEKGKIGTDLMQEAFAPDKGPLTDTTSEKGEQLARMRLFAGAIGSYKNPQSHRDVNLEDSLEALEIIYLANHLLRIVDVRAQAREEKAS